MSTKIQLSLKQTDIEEENANIHFGNIHFRIVFREKM